ALVAQLSANPKIACRACYRTLPAQLPEGAMSFAVGEIESADWSGALHGAEIVVHTVARTHVLNDSEADPLAAYRRVNVAGTTRLAEAAANAGVKRLIYLSSIKVNGESTPIDRPFTEADTPNPTDSYGITKWEAEQALWRVCATTGLEGVVLRPPLIHGPGVKGNLRQLKRLIELGIPLPLANAPNKRSLLSLDNLTSAIAACLTHPAAAGRTFLLSDGEDLSTPELIEEMARAMGRSARLWPFPPALLKAAASIAGRSAVADRLLGSLRVDSGAIREALGWSPTPR
ncbi:MAG: NAD-dependent epimerase/dehydratase family protein, partial [Devosia sp.]